MQNSEGRVGRRIFENFDGCAEIILNQWHFNAFKLTGFLQGNLKTVKRLQKLNLTLSFDTQSSQNVQRS